VVAIALTACLALRPTPPVLAAPEAAQVFHIMEVNKLMVGYNGDTSIQAIEMKMILGGQNLVSGLSFAAYDGNGALVATLGTFTANVANGANGSRVLAATANFAATFGITPDLVITPSIPVTSGQVAFEEAGCRVNVLPYGDVPTPLTSPTAAPPLPAGGATVLVRTVDNATSPTCPLAENAGARFMLTSGGPGHPVPFTNNAGVTVNVLSTVVGVEDSPPAAAPLVRAYPNPTRGVTRIDAPGWQALTIHDVQGRLVRVLTCTSGGPCPAQAGPYRGVWDGDDYRGRAVPSGIYFLRYDGASGPTVVRIAVMR
jgi:hypothetical protein